MSKLANMFAVLNLDAEDDREEAEKPASSKAEADAAHRKPEKSSQSKAMVVNYDGENLASSSSDYRMPLVWIDLEMTGLDITKDRILEIACIITDGKLTKRIEVAIETKYFSWFECYDYFSVFYLFFALRDIIWLYVLGF